MIITNYGDFIDIIKLIFRGFPFTVLYSLTVWDICEFTCAWDRNFIICYFSIGEHWWLYKCNLCMWREYLIYWTWASTAINHYRLIRVTACVATSWGSKLPKIYGSSYKWTKKKPKNHLSQCFRTLHKILCSLHCSQRIPSLYLTDTMDSEHPEELLRFQVKTQTSENH